MLLSLITTTLLLGSALAAIKPPQCRPGHICPIPNRERRDANDSCDYDDVLSDLVANNVDASSFCSGYIDVATKTVYKAMGSTVTHVVLVATKTPVVTVVTTDVV